MEAFSKRSIALMQELRDQFGDQAFQMEYSGYHFISQTTDSIFTDEDAPNFKKQNIVENNPNIIHQKYPYLDPSIKKSIFIKNAGFVDSITMANLMLNESKKAGLAFINKEIVNLTHFEKNISLQFSDRTTMETDQIIIAAGPFINTLGKMLGISFPIWNTLQRKFIIPDPKQVIPREMPFTIYTDAQKINWPAEELMEIKSDHNMHWMLDDFPGAIHIKPESGDRIKMGWAFSTEKVEPHWKIPDFDYFPQIVLQGASRFIPKLKAYTEQMPSPLIEYGGYYTRTKENWPLIGPSSLQNVFVIGALAGFGTMTACAAGELCAQYITERALPDYAPYFHPNRYSNINIRKEIESSSKDGQL